MVDRKPSAAERTGMLEAYGQTALIPRKQVMSPLRRAWEDKTEHYAGRFTTPTNRTLPPETEKQAQRRKAESLVRRSMALDVLAKTRLNPSQFEGVAFGDVPQRSGRETAAYSSQGRGYIMLPPSDHPVFDAPVIHEAQHHLQAQKPYLQSAPTPLREAHMHGWKEGNANKAVEQTVPESPVRTRALAGYDNTVRNGFDRAHRSSVAKIRRLVAEHHPDTHSQYSDRELFLHWSRGYCQGRWGQDHPVYDIGDTEEPMQQQRLF